MGFDTLAVGDTIPYYTANKRVVYGGGGIKPDVYIPYDTTRIAIPVLSMLTSDALGNIMWDYYLRNRDSLRYRSMGDFEMRFKGEDTVIAMYLRSLPAGERKDAETVLKVPVNNQLFRLHMKAQFARYMFRGDGYYQVLAQDDDEIQRALQILSDESYLKIIGR